MATNQKKNNTKVVQKPKPKPKRCQCMNRKCRYEWISRLKGTRIPKECPMCKSYGVKLLR